VSLFSHYVETDVCIIPGVLCGLSGDI